MSFPPRDSDVSFSTCSTSHSTQMISADVSLHRGTAQSSGTTAAFNNKNTRAHPGPSLTHPITSLMNFILLHILSPEITSYLDRRQWVSIAQRNRGSTPLSLSGGLHPTIVSHCSKKELQPYQRASPRLIVSSLQSSPPGFIRSLLIPLMLIIMPKTINNQWQKVSKVSLSTALHSVMRYNSFT